MRKVGTFDVLKVMSERNMDIRLSTLDNVSEMRKIKGGTKITIGFAGDVLKGVYFGKYIGGLLLADTDQFQAIRAELEAQPEPRAGRDLEVK